MNFIVNQKRLKLILYTLEGFGILSTLFLTGLTFGLGIRLHKSPEELAGPFGHMLNDQFQILAFKFCEFLIILLLAMLLNRLDKLPLKVLTIILFAWMLFQAWILFARDLKGGVPKVITEYSEPLGSIAYTGHFFLAFTSILLMLQIAEVFFNYRRRDKT